MTTETMGQAPASSRQPSRLRRAAPPFLSHRTRRWWQVMGGLVVLGFLAWQLGTGPFLDALMVTAGTTWCVAVRWSLLTARFGERVPARAAYVAYYRSQLINATLPGGVVGDVHRGARHGWRGVDG